MRTDEAQRTFSGEVGLEIGVLLYRRGISGRRLAAELGESQTWVSARLSGKTPIDLNDLRRIAAVLEVSPATLLPSGGPLTTTQFVGTPQARPHAVYPGSPRGGMSGSGGSRSRRSRRLVDQMAA